MRFPSLAIASLAVMFVASRPTQAQPPPPPIGWFGPSILLNSKTVQGELKITEEQMAKVKALLAEGWEKDVAFRQSLKDVGEQERIKQLTARMEKVTKERIAFLSELLKPEQVKRLRQIEIQSRSLSAFEVAGVREQLKLTPEQIEKIAALKAETRAIAPALAQAFPDDLETRRIKLEEAIKSLVERAEGNLTEEQKKVWNELIGEPFDLRTAFQNPNPR